MKKLAHIFNSIEYSGAERMIYTLNNYYNSAFRTYIISTGVNKGEFFNEYSKVYKCFHISVSEKRNLNYIINFFEMIQFYRREKIEIVHLHTCRRFFFHVLAAKLGGVKRIIRQVHNNFEFTGIVRLKEIYARYFAKLLGTKIISISQSVYENELKRFKNKTILINNFYNEEIIYPGIDSEKNEIKVRLKIPLNYFVIISIGTCNERKQHAHIIKAVSEIKNKIENIFYLHLGDGELENEEKDLCEKLNIKNKVLFVGNIDNIREYLIISDIYIITSKIEGLSIATIEAMGAGIPTILYDTPGTRDLGLNGAPGIVVEQNVDKLKLKILEMYTSPKKLSILADNCFKYAIAEHSKRKAILNWSNIYND